MLEVFIAVLLTLWRCVFRWMLADVWIFGVADSTFLENAGNHSANGTEYRRHFFSVLCFY